MERKRSVGVTVVRILIIGIVFIIGLFISSNSVSKTEVNIKTDKMEYRRHELDKDRPGETIKISVLNNLNESIFISDFKNSRFFDTQVGFFDKQVGKLEMKTNGSWSNIPLSVTATAYSDGELRPKHNYKYGFTQNMIAAELPLNGTYRIGVFYTTEKQKIAKTREEALSNLAYSNEFIIKRK